MGHAIANSPLGQLMLPDIKLSARHDRSAETTSATLETFEQSLQARSARSTGARRSKGRIASTLEKWLESVRRAAPLAAGSFERLYVQQEALAWLCDLLPTYRPFLDGVLEELTVTLKHLEDRSTENQKLKSQLRHVSGQLQTQQLLHELQLAEAWSVARTAQQTPSPERPERAGSPKKEGGSPRRRVVSHREKELEKKNEQLTEEHQQLTHQLDSLRHQLQEKARHLQQLESAKANAAAAAAAMEAEVQKYAELIDRESAKLSESQAECETLRGTVAELQRAAELALATDPSASVSSLMDLPAKEPTTTNFFTAIKLERDPTAPPEAKEYMPRKPQHMALSADQLMRQRQWDEPQKWTLTIQEWDDVLNCCQDQPAYALFKTHGKKYVNMYDLNQEYVEKWTKGEGCGVAVMMSQHREDSAQLMLSHAWAEDVEECQSAVMEYVREKEVPRTAALWFCLFANYQVGDTSGPSIEAQLKMQPFSSVIKATSLARGEGYGLHAIHTSTADLYKRLWCVHEVERALVGNVDVSTSMSDKYKEQTLQRLEFFLSDSCSDSTWEDCMWAANVKVKTIQARCDRIEDEKMLIKGIMDTGGFERIDETIERFRAKTFGENYELMLKPVGRHGQALKFASFERLEQKLIHNLVLTAVRSSGMSLAHAPAQLKGKKELVMEAVKQNGMALQFAAEDMREDSEVVLQAVSQHGLALQFAEGPALENELVVLAAVAQDGEAFKLAPETMQTKKDIVEKAVLSSPKVLQYVPSELRKVALDAVKSSPQARAQLERSRTMAGIVNQTEQEIERMEELADTKRYVKNAEKTQERLQHAIELMKSVRPHVASQKPKKAMKLTLLALQTMLEHTQDPSLITKARTAVEKHFNSVVEDQKQDFLDFLFDRDVALSASLRDSIFACLVAYKHEMLSKAPLQIDTPMSQPLRRYSLAGASPSREPSKEPPIPERNSKRTVTEIAGLR